MCGGTLPSYHWGGEGGEGGSGKEGREGGRGGNGGETERMSRRIVTYRNNCVTVFGSCAWNVPWSLSGTCCHGNTSTTRLFAWESTRDHSASEKQVHTIYDDTRAVSTRPM